MPKFNYERASSALVEAAYYGNKHAAKRFNVSVRSIERWRVRMGEDDDLAALVAIKKDEFEQHWADALPAAIRATIRVLIKAALNVDPTDPKSVKAAADALKVLAEIRLAKTMLDEEISEYETA